MGINLGRGFGGMQQQQQSMGSAMPIVNLQKNDILDLTKREPGLTNVILGAGWDVSQHGVGFDVDISAVMLNSNGKLQNGGSDVIFFNNKSVQGVQLGSDNRTGAGEGDDEEIKIDLSQVRSDVQKIVFIVNIHDAANRRQTFGMINDSYVRLMNGANNSELCRFVLKDDASTATSMIFAELYRQGTEWQFRAIGEGKMADLNGILGMFI